MRSSCFRSCCWRQARLGAGVRRQLLSLAAVDRMPYVRRIAHLAALLRIPLLFLGLAHVRLSLVAGEVQDAKPERTIQRNLFMLCIMAAWGQWPGASGNELSEISQAPCHPGTAPPSRRVEILKDPLRGCVWRRPCGASVDNQRTFSRPRSINWRVSSLMGPACGAVPPVFAGRW